MIVLRWAAILALAAALLLLLERGFDHVGKPVKGYTDLALTGPAQNYAQALAQFKYLQAGADERAAAMPNDWLLHNVSARAWLARARLTGVYDDFLHAQRALNAAFKVAAPGTGPHMTGAVLAFTMHRLAQAEQYLDAVDRYAVPPEKDELAEIAAMRGDIAFYRGDYPTALSDYDRADALAPGTTDFRRAIYHSYTGRADLSETYLDEAERNLQSPTRLTRTRIEIQRGILDLGRDRFDAALKHFQKADREFPGYWLIEEHVAEIMVLKGDIATAERLYRGIADRTGQPEAMDALAAIASAKGARDESREWTKRAEAQWRVRIKQFPEAAYGHAIDHCAAKGDLPCALALAQRNVRARPYGEAKIKLARALFSFGRKAEALEVIEQVLASPWRTMDLHRTAAAIYAGLGRNADAAEQDRLARRLREGEET